jgi:hypothetical protein
MILGEAKKIVTSMSSNKICMEQNDKIGHRLRKVHHFSFGGGKGVGGIRKILVFHHVPISSYWCSPCSQWVPHKIPQIPNIASLHPISFAQRFSLSHLYGSIKGEALYTHMKMGLE